MAQSKTVSVDIKRAAAAGNGKTDIMRLLPQPVAAPVYVRSKRELDGLDPVVLVGKKMFVLHADGTKSEVIKDYRAAGRRPTQRKAQA